MEYILSSFFFSAHRSVNRSHFHSRRIDEEGGEEGGVFDGRSQRQRDRKENEWGKY